MPTGKLGEGTKVGKLVFYNHYEKDWIKQELSTHAKFRGKFRLGA